MNRHYSSRECIAALMDVNNQIITDKEGICDRLNSFFFSVFEQPTLREVVKTAESNFQVRVKPDPCFVIEDVVTPDMVLKKLRILNSDKSAGVDQVNTHALKTCAESLAGPLSFVLSSL
ncbi:RNA-directed DNA polymerase from mobile element jockey [Brachionus plicatilis]|uniref:RNA-directed DNA polymerase from mobile element jockey n=1 Tax=Brachionus plicatilis TaxID=10195 RepID=A0A3M7P4T8_BRAPC|nr:RNA-directed DNA polymerase from mobile element jockey [Brachionus plicatilis]